MTHIITGLCMRYAGCVKACPVENCILPGQPIDEWPNYYVDPATCIDCGACVPACPYNAILLENDVPDWLRDDIQPNYDYFEYLKSRGQPGESGHG